MIIQQGRGGVLKGKSNFTTLLSANQWVGKQEIVIGSS